MGATEPKDTDTRRKAFLPLAVVLLSLISLAVLPWLTMQRARSYREKVSTAAEPARALVTEIQGELALEAASNRAFLLTGDQDFATSHAQTLARRRKAMSALLPLTLRLGPGVHAQALEVQRHITPVDQSFDALMRGRVSPRTYIERLGDQQDRFESAVTAAVSLDRAISDATIATRADVRRIERVSAVISAVLAILALVAALLVTRLAHAYRKTMVAAEQRRVELEWVTESRTRLVRGFTHDVKNPLGAADGMLQLLEDRILGDMPPKQIEGVGRARRSIQRALSLIAHLLELARAEAGQLETHPIEMNVGAVARDVAEEFRPQALAKRLALSLELAEQLPDVHSDPELVRQVAANLISNAVKYTPDGGSVTVRTRWHNQDGASSSVALDVCDTGTGISAEQQTTLFKEFTRFNPTAAQGSGIGLAISQRVARALGGRIAVSSVPGAGSTFSFVIPVRRQA